VRLRILFQGAFPSTIMLRGVNLSKSGLILQAFTFMRIQISRFMLSVVPLEMEGHKTMLPKP